MPYFACEKRKHTCQGTANDTPSHGERQATANAAPPAKTCTRPSHLGFSVLRGRCTRAAFQPGRAVCNEPMWSSMLAVFSCVLERIVDADRLWLGEPVSVIPANASEPFSPLFSMPAIPGRTARLVQGLDPCSLRWWLAATGSVAPAGRTSAAASTGVGFNSSHDPGVDACVSNRSQHDTDPADATFSNRGFNHTSAGWQPLAKHWRQKWGQIPDEKRRQKAAPSQ